MTTAETTTELDLETETETETELEMDPEIKQITVYYTSQIERCPEFGDALKTYLELLNVVKDIRAICGDDNPEFIKSKIGEEINGVAITQETYDHALLIHEEYTEAYNVCKEYLYKFSRGEL